MNSIQSIWLWRKQIVISLLCLFFIVIFEVFQQYFYVLYFDLAPSEFHLSDVFIGQIRRWTIWLLVSIPFILYLKQKPLNKHSLNGANLFSYFIGILFLIAVNVAFISIAEMFFSNLEITKSLMVEFLIFYSFQKGPIYFIAYIMLMVLTHFFIYAEFMELKIQELASLKQTNKGLYEELKMKSYADSSIVINVKIGNKWKIVPIEIITWIEADDYCVKLHAQDGSAYTIRASMKSFEDKLPLDQFVRVHRKAIVNVNFIKEYTLGDAPQIVLNSGVQIPIAQSRLRDFKLSIQPSMRISS